MRCYIYCTILFCVGFIPNKVGQFFASLLSIDQLVSVQLIHESSFILPKSALQSEGEGRGEGIAIDYHNNPLHTVHAYPIDYILVHGGQKIELAQKIHASRG